LLFFFHLFYPVQLQLLEILRDDFGVDIVNHDRKEILIDELKERVKTLKEMAKMTLTSKMT
jgi:hypothetical protein